MTLLFNKPASVHLEFKTENVGVILNKNTRSKMCTVGWKTCKK
jgi:hypothetical protein